MKEGGNTVKKAKRKVATVGQGRVKILAGTFVMKVVPGARP